MEEAVIIDCLRTAGRKSPARHSAAHSSGRSRRCRYPRSVGEVSAGSAGRDRRCDSGLRDAGSGSGQQHGAHVALRAGLPDTVTGVTINRFCSSGLQSIAMAADRIRAGGAHIMLAGGSESMSMIPLGGNKFAPNPWFVDHRPEIYMNMGLTAEQLQQRYGITREDADEFAYRSHQKALKAQADGKFDEEIVPVTSRSTTMNGDANRKPPNRPSRKTKVRAPTHPSKRWPS